MNHKATFTPSTTHDRRCDATRGKTLSQTSMQKFSRTTYVAAGGSAGSSSRAKRISRELTDNMSRRRTTSTGCEWILIVIAHWSQEDKGKLGETVIWFIDKKNSQLATQNEDMIHVTWSNHLEMRTREDLLMIHEDSLQRRQSKKTRS